MFASTVRGPVLVTGGAGYIGSHVCKALAEAGAQPICLDSLEKGHEWAVQWGALARGDVGDGRFVEEVFVRHKPQVVIHLAGYIEVGESVANPERYLVNNSAKSHVLISAALRHKVEAFVFSSTCAVYGLPQSERLAEAHRIAPINPYAVSKQRRTRPLSGGVARLARRLVALFQRHGRRRRRRDRRGHEPETHLLPLAVDAALGLRGALVVHGEDYPTRRLVRARLCACHRSRRRPSRAVQWLYADRPAVAGTMSSTWVRHWPQCQASRGLGWPAPSGGRFRTSMARGGRAIRPCWWDAFPRPPANWDGRRHDALKRRSRTRCDGGGRCFADRAGLPTRTTGKEKPTRFVSGGPVDELGAGEDSPSAGEG